MQCEVPSSRVTSVQQKKGSRRACPARLIESAPLLDMSNPSGNFREHKQGPFGRQLRVPHSSCVGPKLDRLRFAKFAVRESASSCLRAPSTGYSR